VRSGAERSGAMTGVNRFVYDHLDLTVFLVVVVLVLLIRVVLDSTTNLTLTLLAGTVVVVITSFVGQAKTADS
jgi:putative flippase GtrA